MRIIRLSWKIYLYYSTINLLALHRSTKTQGPETQPVAHTGLVPRVIESPQKDTAV